MKPNDASAIVPRIFAIRGESVMLDSDLAILYGVETRVFNQAIARNVHRFPADFAFQLTREEFADLMFQFGTSSSPGGGASCRGSSPSTALSGLRCRSGILKKPRKKAAPIERTSRRFPEECSFGLTTAEFFSFDITNCDIKFAQRSRA